MRRAAVTTAGTVGGVILLLALKAAQGVPPTGAGTGAQALGASAAPGTYTGEASRTRYGEVQVTVTVAGGRITAVDVVKAPDAGRRDREITARAVPVLVRETIEAQSADIDAVSGATYTSEGYVASLQSALDKADG